jgi:hypothetical protein
MRRSVLFVSAAAALAVAAGPGLASGTTASAPASVYTVGSAAESINPTPEMLAQSFHLGGFGVASTYIAGRELPDPAGLNRNAVGVLGTTDADGHGAHTRAMTVGTARRVIALAQIETQGYFSAYKSGPFGIEEIRKDAAAAINALHSGPGITAGQILVDSDHSHGGADTVGVWGGVPTSYLQLVHDRTVTALVKAYQSMRPANLYYGVAHAGVEGQPDLYPAPDGDALMTNQFRDDPANQVMDDEIRVLQAREPGGATVIGTYVNFSAHPDVLGSSNLYVTGDYPGVVSDQLAAKYGGFGFDQVATLGRSQPARGGCPDGSLSGPAESRCALDQYATRVVRRVDLAVTAATPLTGTPLVALNSYLMTDLATNPVLVAGSLGGFAVGAPLYRAVNPPWFTTDVLGAPSYSGRIGDVLISGGPGEMYPQIVQRVRETVRGMRGYLSIGTAGDFLGYIVAPLAAYPEPIRRSLFDGDPPPTGQEGCLGPLGSPVGCPDPVSNDNYIFNVSHTFGARLACSLLRGAGDVLAGDPRRYWSMRPGCRSFADDLVKPANLDTKFPRQPDLSAVLTH